MKNWMKVALGLVLVLGLQNVTAQVVVDMAALNKAYEKLAELKSVDKASMTKIEKQVWRVEKRAAKSVIAREESKVQFLRDMNYAYRWGNPYGLYGAGFHRFNTWGWGFRPVARPVVVRRPVCRVRT